jgi:hypothetical protein
MILGRRNACIVIATLLAADGRAALAQDVSLPQRWQTGDEPPEIEGIHLGDRRERVAAVLGKPDPSLFPDDPDADPQILVYRGGALMIAIAKADGVMRIMLNRPEGGALAGIRVGDRLGALLRSWGEPTVSRGSLGRYEMCAWSIAVRADLGAQKVLKLMLARTSSQPVIPPPAPPVTDAVPAETAPQPSP